MLILLYLKCLTEYTQTKRCPDMNSRFKRPSFFRMMSRDQLSYAGFLLWVVGAAALVFLPILSRNFSTIGALVYAAFPFGVGTVFIFPRMHLHRHLYRKGRTAEGKMINKEDVTGPHRGSRIVYQYN